MPPRVKCAARSCGTVRRAWSGPLGVTRSRAGHVARLGAMPCLLPWQRHIWISPCDSSERGVRRRCMLERGSAQLALLGVKRAAAFVGGFECALRADGVGRIRCTGGGRLGSHGWYLDGEWPGACDSEGRGHCLDGRSVHRVAGEAGWGRRWEGRQRAEPGRGQCDHRTAGCRLEYPCGGRPVQCDCVLARGGRHPSLRRWQLHVGCQSASLKPGRTGWLNWSADWLSAQRRPRTRARA